MKKIILSFLVAIAFLFPTFVYAEEEDVDEIIDNMTVEEKIAEMIMPAFRQYDDSNVVEITPEIEAVLKEHNFAGVILFANNTSTVEQTTRLVYQLQVANAENPNSNGQLLIAIDQEGGYVTRLGEGTVMPGNMGLGALEDSSLVYDAATVIGSELDAIGINTDFAPVSDVNNNPANPVIGVRSFSDDPDHVAEYAGQFMSGLQDSNIATALKHFPGHGDTSTDTHSQMTIVDKSKDELLEVELKPFQALIDQKTDIIMTAHIQYPQIEDETYVKEDGEEILLPATLSEKIMTGLLRNEMGFDGVIVTDALDMGAIATHFKPLDTARLAINAGVDILLMPVEVKNAAGIDELRKYISDVAQLVNSGQISIDKVNSAVKRILTLKKNKGLLEEYNVDIETKVQNALKTVSTVENHEKEFEIAKQVITLVKNDNEVLPLNPEDKTLFLFYYTSHVGASEYAFTRLINDGIIENSDNFEFFDFDEEMDKITEAMVDAKNVVIIHAMYGLEVSLGGITYKTFDSPLSQNLDQVLALAEQYGVNSVFVSAHLPYDTARYNKADAIVAAYLANGLSFDLENADTTKPIKKYGASVMAAIYQLFNAEAKLTGTLPVNVYDLDAEYNFTEDILYPRGHGLSYGKEEPEEEQEETIPTKVYEKIVPTGIAMNYSRDITIVYFFLLGISILIGFGTNAYLRRFNQ